MARRRFFVDGTHHGQAEIAGDRAHHLRNVLRVEAGQQYEISDNSRVYLARVSLAARSRVVFDLIEELPHATPPVRLWLYASLVKFERFETLIEKATELGVERIVPVTAERSERGLERAAGKRLERWRRIAQEASQQSRRARLAEVAAAASLEQALTAEAGFRCFLDEAGAPPLLSVIPAARRPDDVAALLVGPEGGWTEREREHALGSGWHAASLGPLVLRTETAAMAALAVLSAAWAAGR
jgi:16S rRNA (uracil1498-N3)-methyltransferase